MTRRFSWVTGAALIAGALSAHGANAQSPVVPPARLVDRYPFVQADVQFLQGMIAHHNQAVVMANWAASHGASRDVRVFCGRIAMAQTAEIASMQQWLADHGQPVPHPDAKSAMTTMAGMPGMAMGDTLMPGMLTPEQMKQLDHARGKEFDSLFLTFMIQHHSGAIMMVQHLFASKGAAQDDFIFKFANDVQADQTTEIDRMQSMLDAMDAGGKS